MLERIAEASEQRIGRTGEVAQASQLRSGSGDMTTTGLFEQAAAVSAVTAMSASHTLPRVSREALRIPWQRLAAMERPARRATLSALRAKPQLHARWPAPPESQS